MEADVGALERLADEYAEKTQATGKVTFITKINSFSQTVKEKKASLLKIEKLIDEKTDIQHLVSGKHLLKHGLPMSPELVLVTSEIWLATLKLCQTFCHLTE
ncbi:hypothetical protein MHYP_G00258530 [Metynnis hypsauchen]